MPDYITRKRISTLEYKAKYEPWFLARKPDSPHTLDEEFEGSRTLTDKGWSIGPGLVSTAIDPYASFNTVASYRTSLDSIRASWLMVQSTNDGTIVYPVHRSLTVPTNLLVWARLSWFSRNAAAADNDNVLGIIMSASTAAGLPDPNNSVALHINETEANEYAFQFWVSNGGAFTTTERVNLLTTEHFSFEYVAMQKIGTAMHYWVAPASGNWFWLGSATYAGPTMDRVGLYVQNSSGSSPGNMICGVDFIRFRESADWLP